jgi:carboxyl-terminal processing protease
MTDSGRTVYGGNGIAPDEKYETPKMDSLESALYRDGLFNFTRSYFGKHSTALPKGWTPDAAVMGELYEYLLKTGAKFDEQQFKNDRDWIQRRLLREMYTTAFGLDESDRIFAQTDPEVEKGIESLPKAVALAQNAKKVIVERMHSREVAAGAARR